jgi:hypothetical protein
MGNFIKHLLMICVENYVQSGFKLRLENGNEVSITTHEELVALYHKMQDEGKMTEELRELMKKIERRFQVVYVSQQLSSQNTNIHHQPPFVPVINEQKEVTGFLFS